MSRELHPDFEEVGLPDSSYEQLQIVVPRRRGPTLARPGMAVSVINHSSDYGVITHALRDWCILRGCNKGEQIAATWGEVELVDVQPDPAFIIPPPEQPPAPPAEPAAAAADAPPLTILAATWGGHPGGGPLDEGYLVVDRARGAVEPVAFVPLVDASGDPALDAAKDISRDPSSMGGLDARHVDLRHCGRPGSPLPVPPELYGMCFAPADDHGKYRDSELTHIVFFCRFMLERLQSSRAAATVGGRDGLHVVVAVELKKEGGGDAKA
jgi:hypothetical protein